MSKRGRSSYARSAPGALVWPERQRSSSPLRMAQPPGGLKLNVHSFLQARPRLSRAGQIVVEAASATCAESCQHNLASARQPRACLQETVHFQLQPTGWLGHPQG